MNRFKRFWNKFLKKIRTHAIYRSSVHPSAVLESGTSFYHSTIGKFSFCGYDCDINNATIGSFTSIANGVAIGMGRHPLEWAAMSCVFYNNRDSIKTKFAMHSRPPELPVVIGSDVWIGRQAAILPGVNVGHGAVIGAGSVVTKEVPPYAIVAGNPAKIIRYRFGAATITRLLDSQWWTLSNDAIQKLGPSVPNVEAFLNLIEVITHRSNKHE